MSAMDNRLDIWIGKLLDGEISPKERCLLENELERDRHAQELFEQMRILHECSCGVVTHEILGRGADPADVFERAWQQSRRSFWRRAINKVPPCDGSHGGIPAQQHRLGAARGRLFREPRLAIGIAAGLLLGLLLNLLPIPQTQIPSAVPSGPLVAGNVPSGREEIPNVMVRAWDGSSRGTVRVGKPDPESLRILPAAPAQEPHQITLEVDWYIFTDRAGNQWLLEGMYEGAREPVAHSGSL